ncbi:MAG: hypothetical protein JWR19_3548 [Pedosphaera sp.]|nr:hypothetical protein [Pedosphaera sp.]
METVHIYYAIPHRCRSASLLRCLTLALLWLSSTSSLRADAPAFSAPVRLVSPTYAQLTLTNCNNVSNYYVMQFSTNLQDWVSYKTNHVISLTDPMIDFAPATNDTCFYRVIAVPFGPPYPFQWAMALGTNFNGNGKNPLVDSYDSSDTNYSSVATNAVQYYGTNVVQIYDASRAKSGGDVAVYAAVTGNVILGNGTINGHLHTGPGSLETQLQIGPHGTVGDITFAASNSGIQGDGTSSSWWAPDFNGGFYEVKAPTFTGTALPAPDSHGNTVLNGGTYTTTSSTIVSKLVVTGPTTLWVQGSASLGVTIAGTNASLILYVGKATGTGDSISLSGNGTMNTPGYARNLQIYGLPSLTSIDLHGNMAINAAIYAPNAAMVNGGGGTNTQNSVGSIVVKSMTLVGKWNFHYDENLKTSLAPF